MDLAWVMPIRTSDISQIMVWGINTPAFNGFWPEEVIHNFVKDGLSRGIYIGGPTIIGFVLAAYQPITKKLTWENAYLEPNYRKLDLGVIAFSEVWKEAVQRGATFAEGLVEHSNHNPERILLKSGFKDLGLYHWYHKTTAI